MSYYQIPLTCASDCTQNFNVTLPGDDGKKRNVNIELRLRYLDRYDVWLADVTELATGAIVALGVPLVPGEDILGQLGYKGVGEAYIMQALPTSLQHPGNKTLGSTFVLIWGDAS